MEEYESTANYLRHLKKIAHIQEGNRKPTVLSAIFKTRRVHHNSRTVSTSNSKREHEGKQHTSTERIMRDFTVAKENIRLAEKIVRMNSSIPMKKYEQQYETVKKGLLKEGHWRRQQKYMWFKFFDICVSMGSSSSPEDRFKVFAIKSGKKVLVASGTLFELRKKQIRVGRREGLLKVEGTDGQGGMVRVSEESLMDVVSKGIKVGHVVVQHVKK